MPRKDTALVPHQSDFSAPVTPEEFRALLRVAGLEISEDRAPEVLAELNAQLALARTIEPLMAGTDAPALAPYDPAFPEIRLPEEPS